MHQTELVAAIAARNKVSKAAADRTIKGMIEIIMEELKRGERVTLIGFGAFSTKPFPERPGTNPRTGEKIVLRAKRQVKFTVAPEFKALVR